jgi:hypothetical protein
MVLGAALVIWRRRLEVGEDLKAKGLVKSRGTYDFIYMTGKKDRGLRSWHVSRKTWKVERFP